VPHVKVTKIKVFMLCRRLNQPSFNTSKTFGPSMGIYQRLDPQLLMEFSMGFVIYKEYFFFFFW
jgi:hypothetical protein